MPFLLKDRDISSEISNVRSVLIVPCRFCPAASLAVREKKPYMELFKALGRTPVYEAYIRALKSRMQRAGIKAEVFTSRLPHHSVVCMWTSGRRRNLRRHASDYDAVVVLGCDAAMKTAEDSMRSTNCRVVAGMAVDGLMNIIPSFRFPGTVSLEVSSVIRVLDYSSSKAGQ